MPYQITVISNYEEDSNEPYTVEFDTYTEAINAYYQYENERTICGSKAYSVTLPVKIKGDDDTNGRTN